MIRHFLNAANETKIQAQYWMWAAWTLPFLALAILTFEYFLGWESFYSKTFVIISVSFFTVSVFWWWWAINKIIVLLESFHRTEQHFEDVKHELRETRKVIRGE
jgi:hypothetical protein